MNKPTNNLQWVIDNSPDWVEFEDGMFCYNDEDGEGQASYLNAEDLACGKVTFIDATGHPDLCGKLQAHFDALLAEPEVKQYVVIPDDLFENSEFYLHSSLEDARTEVRVSKDRTSVYEVKLVE